ncbi:MAG TPA: hypothetical protein VJU61_16750 [Polyangiaceae bacterium]|nr:hypothetical protein [Polyangiaceae bacterium]
MKPSALARVLPWLLIAIAPALLGRCGGAVARNAEKEEGTVSDGSGSQAVQGNSSASDGTADAGSVPSGACETLRQTLAARVTAGFANLDTTCERDEECFYASTDTGCYSSCESVIVSRSGDRTTGTAVLQDIAPLCAEFDSQRCETPDFGCVGGSPVLVCNGTCARIDELGCNDLQARADARLTTVINDASRACSQDSDCALVQAAIDCVSSCGYPQIVASSAVEGLARAIAETEGRYCGTAESRGCPRPSPPGCPPLAGTPQASCNAGQCEISLVPLP